MQEYVAAHMNTAAPGVPSLAIHPRQFKDIAGKDCLSENELLIMSRRVFGHCQRTDNTNFSQVISVQQQEKSKKRSRQISVWQTDGTASFSLTRRVFS